jgi:predicted GH43/DUF377 family glycosyl hydrolase
MTSELITPTDIHVLADHTRLVPIFFGAGVDFGQPGGAKSSGVVERVLGLSEREVEQMLREVFTRSVNRHRNLTGVLDTHARILEGHLGELDLSPARRALLGAVFTSEYAMEAASATNPSMVLHPDQRGAELGGARFVMSYRAIGEGHRSSIGFYTGGVTAGGAVSLDRRGEYPLFGATSDGVLRKDVVLAKLRGRTNDVLATTHVLAYLPPIFSRGDLEARLTIFLGDPERPKEAEALAKSLRTIASLSYDVAFREDTEISERVLWPYIPVESRGMEDARFVRFSDEGQVVYLATYTAYDGSRVSTQLIQTDDFRKFSMRPVTGAAERHKGLSIFPRRIGGRYAALSRYNNESNGVVFSENLDSWGRSTTLQTPKAGWEIVLLGNAGSPIETPEGWLVLTHGVGPMRTYAIGAILLDLDDPTKLLGHLPGALITAEADEALGYVPNVVYSCGAMSFRDTLIIPYGVADMRLRVCTAHIPDLVAGMQRR